MRFAICSIPLILAISLSSVAEEKMDKTPPQGPCRQIHAACEAAGFVKGAHKEGKGLFKDCMKKIIHGETVPGVTIDAQVVAQCKERKAKKGGNKETE